MRAPVLLVVHNRNSRPGQVAAALAAKGWPTRRCCPRAGDALPESFDVIAGVVVFGGPMSANDDATLPFIRAELDWIPKVLASKTPFFGICLGAQMLARCLGGTVGPHARGLHEIGYYPIEPTAEGAALFPEPVQVYHWHGEGFTLPADAELLATGETYRNQMFRCNGSAYGVQFHPEMQEDILKWWMQQATHKLGAPGAQPPEAQLTGHARHAAAMHRWLDGFLDHWLSDAAKSGSRLIGPI
ncbi:MAG: gamma-glutamyl-gamma-aminobutyrate hydrolase family protein [Alphaproteobacteria bacterium]